MAENRPDVVEFDSDEGSTDVAHPWSTEARLRSGDEGGFAASRRRTKNEQTMTI